jgi:hypothetical protein
MAREHFNYTDITQLYNSSGQVISANKGSFTHLTREVYLELRADVDYLGELLNQTGSKWTSNHYDWARGSTAELSAEGQHWLSYIKDLRNAVADLWTTAGLSGSPTWTIATANLKPLYYAGLTATTSGSVLTLSGADFSDVTNNSDYLYVKSGTGVNVGKYQITAHTTTTLTVDGTLGTSTAGDVAFIVTLSGNQANFTDVRLKSLYQDIRDHLITISETIFIYAAINSGSDTTGDGTIGNPYKTLDKCIAVIQAAGSGNIYMIEPGTYITYGLLTKDNVLIRGTVTGDVIVHIHHTATFINQGDSQKLRFLYFGDGSTQGRLTNASTNLDIKYCGFRAPNSASHGARFGNATGTIDHCTVYGQGHASSKGLLFEYTSTNFTIDNTIFKDVGTGAYSYNGTCTLDYCGFENVTTKVGGTATNSNEVSGSSTEPNLSIPANLYLNDDSDWINAGSDGLDLGAIDSLYNLFRTASDSVSSTDTTDMALSESLSDNVITLDNLTTVNMNVSIDMMCGGLFSSSALGVVTYKTAASYNLIMNGVPDEDEVYDGAFIDMSWDNAGGDLCEVHIAIDDGVTDYTPVSWWVTNAGNPAISTTQINGTRGYGIDLTIETKAGDEWGDKGDFTTVTADGVNDQKWDIILKVRVKNINTGSWSEVVTVSKTYEFNKFDGTMHYLGDNPRIVAGEYENHANYLVQTYHTGTAVYTRPDGVAWGNDPRRYWCNPFVRCYNHIIFSAAPNTVSDLNNAYELWQERTVGSAPQANASRQRTAIYACCYLNFGNWNNGGNSAISNKNAIVYQNGTEQFGTPFGSGSNDIKAMGWTGQCGSDCNIHGSHSGAGISFPGNNKVIVWGDWVTKFGMWDHSDVFFQDGNNFYPSCSHYGLGSEFFMRIKTTDPYPTGYSAWAFSLQGVKVNVNLYDQTFKFGGYSYKAVWSTGQFDPEAFQTPKF